MVRSESRVDFVEMEQRLKHQPSSDQQDNRKRDLHDDQSTANAATSGVDDATPGLLQCVGDGATRDAAGWSQSEHNPGRPGDSNRKQKDWAIKTDRGGARERQRDEIRQESEGPRSEKHTHETAEKCKKHA